MDNGIPRDQCLCQQCDLHAVHDERHLVFECPAMQPAIPQPLPCSV